MPSRNIIYSDLGWSFYPAKIDSRDGKNPLTGTIDTTTYAKNDDLELNVNYQDRGSSPTAKDYYVLAEDINVLQDAVLAIQRVLGTMPQGTFSTVKDRLVDLSNPARYDDRFGGAGWTNIPTNYPGIERPTILSHRHTGQPYSAPKIDLATEATGSLSKSRLQLSNSDADPLTSEHILIAKGSGTTIKGSLDSKLDKSGGTITGSLTVQGNSICRLFGEFDCKDFQQTTGSSNVADADAYSGMARKFSKSATFNPNGYSVSFPLRYGEYCVTIRAKCIENSSQSNVLRMAVWETNSSGGQKIITDRYIRASHFETAGQYQSFYYTVLHQYSGSSNKNLHITIWYHGSNISDVYLDSITIMPVHTSVWDE